MQNRRLRWSTAMTTSRSASMPSLYQPSTTILMKKQTMLAKIKTDIISILIPRVKAKYPKYAHFFNDRY
jgi:hypothetical protein